MSDELEAFGWWPGDYQGRCKECLELFYDGGKHAYRCKPCAEKSLAYHKENHCVSPSISGKSQYLLPVTIQELAERGMDPRLSEILLSVIISRLKLTEEELRALGSALVGNQSSVC